MKENTFEKGKSGENKAADYLRTLGYTISAKNWRMGKYEIDLIAENDDTILFVEVKTRSGFEIPVDRALRAQQKLNIIKSANAYINEVKSLKEPRFDLITIFGFGNKSKLSHIESCFYPTLLSARSL
jgi:putative endonuclease